MIDAAGGQLEDLLDWQLAAALHGVSGPERPGPVEFAGQGVDGNDARRAGQAGALDAVDPHAATPDD